MSAHGRNGIGRRVWSIVWTVFLVLGLSAAATTFRPASMTPVAEAGTGASPDGKLSVTKTASATTLPVGGGPVTYTYTVRNTTAARTLYYSSMTDDRCGNVRHSSGMRQDARGDSYLPPGGSATFTCTTTVTSTVTNTVTAQFHDYGDGRTSTARATETVNVPVGAMTCDQIWYSSFGSGSMPTWLGTVSPSGATQRANPLVTYNGTDYRFVTSLAINPRDNQWVYYIPRAGGDAAVNAGLWRYSVTSGKKEQVTTPQSPATTTNRLAFSSDGVLWSWASNGRLYSLAPGATTWADRGAVVSGTANLADLSSGDMVFDGIGNLWLIASDGRTNSLYTISAAGLVGSGTNAASFIGSMGTGVTFNGLAFAPNGTLYASAPNVGGTTNSFLYTVNTSTGTATAVSGSLASATYGQLGDLASCALPKPELQVTKTTDVQTTQAGGLITYTVTMKNIGTAAATEVTFQDRTRENTTYVSSTLNGRAVGTPGVNPWTTPQPVTGSTATVPGVVPAGDTATITITVRVNDPLPAGVTQIVNSGIYDYVGIDPTPTDDPSQPGGQDPTVTAINRSAIAVDKVADPVTLTETGQVLYTYQVANLGTDPIRDVSVSDDRCSPLTRTGGDTNNDGLLDLKETWTYQCRQTLTHSHTTAGPETVTNTVTATGTGTFTSTPVTARDTADVVVTPGTPGLDLVKTVTDASGDRSAAVDETLTYSFTVTNTGQVPLAPVTISDPTLGLTDVPCVASLAPGATATCPAYTYTVTQANVDAGSITNTATATGTPPFGTPVTGGSSATIPTTSTTGLVLDKAADRTSGLVLGDVVTYSFTVTNTGARTLAPVTVTDARLGLVDQACVRALAPGATATCEVPGTHTISQADVDAGVFVNSATASGVPAGGGSPVTGDDTETVTVSGTPALEVSKVADVVSGLAVGDTVRYTFTVRNAGTLTLSPVTITDERVGLSNAACVASLAPGQAARCSSSGAHVISQADVDAGEFVNTVTASGVPPSGGPVTASDEESVSTTRTPGLRVVKTADRDEGLLLDEVVSYTFTVTNSGTVTLAPVTISDQRVGLTNAPCVASLAPGASATCSTVAKYTITQADVDAGSVLNEVSATGTDPSGASVSAWGREIVTTAGVPAVSVVKSADRSTGLGVGDVVTYSFTVTNTGGVTLDTVTVSDPLLGLTDGPCVESLAPGASATCSTVAEYAITQADVDAGGFTNTATATGTPPHGGPVTGSDDAVVTTRVASGIEVAKLADHTSGLSVGQQVAYTFLVRNTGTVTVSDVRVADPGLGIDDQACVAMLAPGATATCAATGTHEITQAEVDAGRYLNTVTVTGSIPGGGTVTDSDTATVTTTRTPGLSVAKAADVDSDLRAGDTVRYTFTVSNQGTVTLSPVRITDERAGLTDEPCVASLAPGATATCTTEGQYTITQADVDAGSVLNEVTATGIDPSGGRIDASAQKVVTTTGVPSIDVVKTADTSAGVDVGDVVTYSFTVRNTGTVTLAPVTVTDPLLGLTAAPCVDSLAPGATARCTTTGGYTLTQADVDAGSVENTATVTGTPPSGPTVGDEGHAVVAPDGTAGLNLDKVPDRTSGLTVSDEVTYRFTVTNTGAVTLAPVTITDPLLGIDGARCVGSLAPDETATCTVTGAYTVTQADVDGGGVSNTATATGTLPRGGTITDADTEIVATTGTPAIEVVKSASPATAVVAGDVVTYTFTVRNAGTVTLAPVTIADAELGLTDGPCVDSLAPGETATCSTAARYTITQPDVDAGGFTNTAVATGTPPSGEPVTGRGQAVVTPDGATGLELDKVADRTSGLVVGDEVQYSFTVTNTGARTLAPVTVTDARLGIVDRPCVASLAPGRTATCEVTGSHTISQADMDAGEVVNSASASGVPSGGGTPVTGADTETVTTAGEAGLLLTKTADLAEGRYAGGVVNYTFTVQNTGTVTLAPVTITDPALEIADAACVDSLAPGATATCSTTASYTLTRADVLASRFDNTATASGTPPAGRPVTSTDTETVTMVQTPGLAVDKVADRTTGLVVGDVVTYRFTVTNTGESTLAPVTLADDKLGIADVTCAASLAVGQTVTCPVTGTYTITQDDVNRGSFDNTVTATGTDSSGAEINSSDTETVTTETSRALDLRKSVDDTGTGMDGEPVEGVSDDGIAQRGERIVYTFTVTNTGNTDLRNVFVDDARLGLSHHLCAESLAPGATATCAVTYEVTAADVAAGAILNRATANAHNPADPEDPVDSLPDEATIPTQPARTGLALDKSVADASGDGIAQVGEVLTYTFTVTNSGETTLTDIVVADDRLPTGRVECLASLAPGATGRCTATYTVTAADVAAGPTLVNTATAEGTTADGSPAGSAPDDATIATETAGLTLDKKVADASGDGIAQAGELLTYTFTVTNTGPVTVSGLRIEETAFNGTGDRSSLDAPSCGVTMLAPATSTTCTATYRVTQADLDTVRPLLANTAVARATDPTGGGLASNEDSATIPPATQNPGLVVDKKVADASGDGIARVGETLTYTFTVRNTGDVTLTAVGVTEASFSGAGDLPVPVCAATTLTPGAVTTCTATYIVTRADVDARAPLVNEAHATGTTPSGGTVTSPTDDATIPTTCDCGPAAPGPGDGSSGGSLGWLTGIIGLIAGGSSGSTGGAGSTGSGPGSSGSTGSPGSPGSAGSPGAPGSTGSAVPGSLGGVVGSLALGSLGLGSAQGPGPEAPGSGPGSAGSVGSAGSTGSTGSTGSAEHGSLGGVVGSLALGSLGLGSAQGPGSAAPVSGPGSSPTTGPGSEERPGQGSGPSTPGDGGTATAPGLPTLPGRQGPGAAAQPGTLTNVTTDGGAPTTSRDRSGGALANTGVTVAALAGATLLSIAVGAGLVLASRKRRDGRTEGTDR